MRETLSDAGLLTTAKVDNEMSPNFAFAGWRLRSTLEERRLNSTL